MITFKIDKIIPCLEKVETGEVFDTEVLRIKRKSFLSKFNKRTGWYVNWDSFNEDTEIYALVLKGTVNIQGLIAIKYDEVAKAVYIVWACTAPQYNILKTEKQEFAGVGGHLFAMASELSVNHGYEGFVYGEAIDKELFEYYCEQFNASKLPALNNPYRFMLSDKATLEMRQVCNYEWTDDNL